MGVRSSTHLTKAPSAPQLTRERSNGTFPDRWDAAGTQEDARPNSRPTLARTHERAPVRPSLPCVVLCLPAAWAGVAVTTTCDIAVHFGQTNLSWALAWILPALILIAAVGLCLRASRYWRCVLALCLACTAGTLCGHGRVQATLQAAEAIVQSPVSSYEFVLTSDASPSERGGFQAQADVYAKTSQRRMRLSGVWVRLPASAGDKRLYVGTHLRAVGRWSQPENDEWGREQLGRGVSAYVTVTRITQSSAADGLLGALRNVRSGMLGSLDLADPGLALTAGVVLGHQAAFSSQEASICFSNLGLSHLVAVSGSHLAVVAGLLGAVLGRTRARPALRLVLVSSALAAYVVLTGVQPSAARAFVMVLAAMSGRVLGRRSNALSGLGTAALVMLLFDPALASRLAFKLSVASVFGIACLGSLTGRWVRAALPARMPEATCDALALTLVAQTCTLPLTLPAFGVLPVLSPLANVLVAPLVSTLLTIGVVAVPLGCALPALASPTHELCAALGSAACHLAQTLAGIPYAAVAAGVSQGFCTAVSAFVVAGIYLAWPHPTRTRARAALLTAMLMLAVTFVSWRCIAPERIVMLDVGQGDAILMQQGPHAVLVDTGPGDAIVQALGRHHVIHLDAVVLTHTDADHADGLKSMLGLVQVDKVILAQGVADIAQREKPELARTIQRIARAGSEEVAAGDSLHAGTFTLDVIWPRAEVLEESNATSVICVAHTGKESSGGMSVLLTGDAESEQVEPLVLAGVTGQVDVLKVGHHGSAVSTSAAMLRGLQPELAVISAGEGNRYGHPTPACLEQLASAGVPELCTIEHGDIDMRAGNTGVRVRTQR